MSCTERNNKIFTTPRLLVGPQSLVFLFEFCICIFNVTRHNWLDLENPQEAILYLFELKNLPLLCRLFFPLASNAYFLPGDTLMCIWICVVYFTLVFVFVFPADLLLRTSYVCAHTHVSQGKRESELLLLGQTLLITRVQSRNFQICIFSTKK